MRIGKLLKTSGIAALIAAMTVTAMPVSAQDGERNRRESRGEARQMRGNDADINQVRQRSRQVENRSERRAERVDNRSERRAAQVDNRSERRADRVETRGDRQAARAAEQGQVRQANRIDRRSERAATQIERDGDRRAVRIERNGDRNAARIERNGDRRAGQVVRYGDRNDRNWNNRDRGNWDRDRDRREWNDRDRRDHRRWDSRGWRNDRRYNWNNYRSSNRRLYSLGRYYSPYRNYSYRRLNIGFSLDRLFFGSRYWISDPWQYRLPAVYGNYRWVRYYDDVLLIDTYSGEVVDVIYDFFW